MVLDHVISDDTVTLMHADLRIDSTTVTLLVSWGHDGPHCAFSFQFPLTRPVCNKYIVIVVVLSVNCLK